MKIASFRNAGRAAALIGATALLSSHVVVEAAPAIAETALALPKEARGFNGMGVVSLVAAVVEFLKGSNAYVGPNQKLESELRGREVVD